MSITWLAIVGAISTVVVQKTSVEFPFVILEALLGFALGECVIVLWLYRDVSDPRVTAVVPLLVSVLPLGAGTAIAVGILAAGLSGASVFTVLGLVGFFFMRRRWRRKEV